MESLQSLLAEIARRHFTQPGASRELIDACETRLGRKLPEDVREFYFFTNGANLFDRIDSPFSIFPLAELCHPSDLIGGADEVTPASEWLVAFCDVRDGNYLALDLRPDIANCPIIDCFHETFPDAEYLDTVAATFVEFLSKALKNEGGQFWLDD